MDTSLMRVEYSDEMKTNYVNYAMSVIVQRALPDARDGFKPVQRRILYAMKQIGLSPEVGYKKCARIVGDTMGKYHPHGDSSIYEATVNLSRPWIHPIPIVDGHGNFGSIEGDGAAAMRYTEARLSKAAYKYLLANVTKEIVPFVPNFDGTEEEPTVLPVRFPNLLVNGTSGIAVGMACSIPSHNLGEVIDAASYYISQRIKGKTATTEQLMEYLPGPDFATGGVIANKEDLLSIYQTGNGKIRVRGKVHVETLKGGKQRIVITEIPFPMVKKIEPFLNRVADLTRDKKILDIVDISNLSSKEGVKLCIDIKKDADAQKIINQLYCYTDLESTFPVNMLAVLDNAPIVLSLEKALEVYSDFQFEIYTKRIQTLLDKEREISEVKEGLIQATDVIDTIIAVLRGSKQAKDARNCLMTGDTSLISFKFKEIEKEAKTFCFTERQTNAIMMMRMQALVGLEILKLKEDLKESQAKIKTNEKLLEKEQNMYRKILKDLVEVKEDLCEPRKTVITSSEKIHIEKEVEEKQDCIVLIDRFGYIKCVDVSTYDKNKEVIEKDFTHMIATHTMDKILLFTQDGTLHQIKVRDIPSTKLRGKGEAFENLCGYQGEPIKLILSEEQASISNLLFVTQKGYIKCCFGGEFIVTRKKTEATKLSDEDQLVYVGVITAKDDSVALCTKNGLFLRGKADGIRQYKKSAAGCKAISLKGDDVVTDVSIGGASSGVVSDVAFSRIKLSSFGGKGTKLRL